MKTLLKNQTAKTQNQTSKSQRKVKNLTTSKMKLYDFIKNQLGGVELTPEQMQEFEPERPAVNYSMFTFNPDAQYNF